jgi:hypothetical protein
VKIRPDLIGLDWARGTEPTPNGPISVDLRRADAGMEVRLNLPSGVDADVSMPALPGAATVLVNGQTVAGRPVENGARLVIGLNKAGVYKLEAR